MSYATSDAEMPDHFGHFARRNRKWSGFLMTCVGEYEVYRPGFKYVEAEVVPDWAGRQRYSLRITDVLGNGEHFSFRYWDAAATSETQNPLSWEGVALAAEQVVYLLGVDSRCEHDVALFILSLHPTHGADLLVGMQLAQLDDRDERETTPFRTGFPGTGRRLAVSRRIAAVRRGGAVQRDQMESEATNWIDQDPRKMGAVVTLHSPSPRRAHDD
jgi:hypothetical protein